MHCGLKAHRSCEAICKFLEKRNFAVTRNFKGIKSTFLAEYGRTKVGSKQSANVAILCRYDAVPERGHVKGTHLTAEVAVAVALALKAVISSTADRLGKVRDGAQPSLSSTGFLHEQMLHRLMI